MKIESAPALLACFGEGGYVVTARAPGRVNLIGEHTDYNGGFVLPAAIGDFVEVSLRCRNDGRIRGLAMDYNEEYMGELDSVRPLESPHWARYFLGLGWELKSLGHLDRGFDFAFRGTVPPGAGLSSSAALETAAALALEKAFGFEMDLLQSVKLCRRVEHRWVDVQCGIMDQMACRLGQENQAILIDCRSLEWREVPLALPGHSLVVTFSGVQRRLDNSAYNRRREECNEGLAQLRSADPFLSHLREFDSSRHSTFLDKMAPSIASRIRHVVEENNRVLQAARYLENGDLSSFGKLMLESHHSLRDLYEVSHPVLDRLVESAMGIDGVLGSRLTGAGFGGCTITLCEDSSVDSLRAAMQIILREEGLKGWVRRVGRVIPAGVVEEAS